MSPTQAQSNGPVQDLVNMPFQSNTAYGVPLIWTWRVVEVAEEEEEGSRMEIESVRDLIVVREARKFRVVAPFLPDPVESNGFFVPRGAGCWYSRTVTKMVRTMSVGRKLLEQVERLGQRNRQSRANIGPGIIHIASRS